MGTVPGLQAEVRLACCPCHLQHQAWEWHSRQGGRSGRRGLAAFPSCPVCPSPSGCSEQVILCSTLDLGCGQLSGWLWSTLWTTQGHGLTDRLLGLCAGSDLGLRGPKTAVVLSPPSGRAGTVGPPGARCRSTEACLMGQGGWPLRPLWDERPCLEPQAPSLHLEVLPGGLCLVRSGAQAEPHFPISFYRTFRWDAFLASPMGRLAKPCWLWL